ncbi:Uma2 family endonuclease [Actinoplanes utahensis]|nr:Uma2 family endonuclease [Actinoplanes utahensis]
MIAADRHGHRYETSMHGVLTVVPAPDDGHADLVARLTSWFDGNGGTGRLRQAPGLRITGPAGDAGRFPDLALWHSDPGRATWHAADGILLVIEVLSPASEATDEVTKVEEYAHAGIPRYWTVARDAADTTTIRCLTAGGGYRATAMMPLSWLLARPITDLLPAGNGLPPAGNDPHPVGNDPHPVGNDPHPAGNDPHPAGNDPHPAGTDTSDPTAPRWTPRRLHNWRKRVPAPPHRRVKMSRRSAGVVTGRSQTKPRHT